MLLIMKKFIHKTNTYLIENHPTVWNTKLVWMLSITIILHILFFLFGILVLSNPESLQERSAYSIFFENGTVFFSIMVSIVLIVVWLISMFKNNGFKNFYPTRRIDLFKQFLIYFVIIFCSTTFYYSYTIGLKTYIVSKYDDNIITSEIALANKTAPFFSHGLKQYTIDNLDYPEPFNDLYCEVRKDEIDYSKIYYNYLDQDYQFYNLYTKTINLDREYTIDSTYDNNVYTEIKDSLKYFYFKDKVVDVTEQLITTEPSYYNYSRLFYEPKSSNFKSSNSHDYSYNNKYRYNYINYRSEKRKQLIYTLTKENFNLLKREDKAEIKELFENFIVLANKYKIKHNLDAETWTNLIYFPKAFKVSALIKDEYQKYETYAYETNLTQLQKRHKNIETDYYLESDALGTVFENIEEIKAKPIINDGIHVFLWITFGLALLIFMFRVTGLKALLFSIVSVGLLAIFISLVFAFISFITNYRSNSMEYFMVYFLLFVGVTLLSIGLFFTTKIRKQIAAVFINISLTGFVLFILLIISIISMHQNDYCRDNGYYNMYTLMPNKKPCFILIEQLGLNLTSIGLFIVGLLFVFLYSKIILNWKASHEG